MSIPNTSLLDKLVEVIDSRGPVWYDGCPMAAAAPLPRPTQLDDVPVAPPTTWDETTRWYAYDATEVDNEVCQTACEAGLAVDILHSSTHTDGGKGSDKLLGAWTLRERWAYFRDSPTVYNRLCAIPDSIQAGRRFMVLDIDFLKPGFDPDRRSVCEAALAATGLVLDRCPMTRTQSGGIHYWVRIDPESPQWRDSLTFKTPGLDLIADNQHVCIPPTPGYTWVRPIPDSTSPEWRAVPIMTPAIYLALRTAIEVSKPGRALGDRPTGSAPGRNEWCNRFLYRTCNSALRGLPDESMRKLARSRAEMEWEEMLAEMEREQNRPRSDWNISDTDFDRAWVKAIAIQEFGRQMGVEWVDDMLWAWWEQGMKGGERETGRFLLLSQPIASFSRQTVIAGPPDAPPVDRGNGTLIRFLNGETAFLPRMQPGKTQVEQALGSAMLGDHPKAMFKTPNGYQSWQAARMVSADLAADNHAIQLPTGVWWKDEFPREYQSIVPQADWAFYGLDEGPYVPGDRHETRTGFYPLTAEWVSTANATAIPPWTPPQHGQSNQATCAAFLRTLAGFQYPDVAAPGCALVTYGLMRGWLSRLVEQLPMIVIEGPSETGKSKGLFQAVWQLAGATPSTPSVAEARSSMTLSNCGYVVMDDVDFAGREKDRWQELFRQQQNRQRNSNMTGNRYLLACMVSISEGFPFYQDKAINNRILRIVVTDRLRHRKSLLNPNEPQKVDLHQISDRECEKHRAELTRRVLAGLGMVTNPTQQMRHILKWWANTNSTSGRQQDGNAAVEMALRVFCWVAQGSDPSVEWFHPDYDPAFNTDDGYPLNLVAVFREMYGSQTQYEVEDQTKLENPLYFALAEYFKSFGMGMAWDWARTGMPGGDLSATGATDIRRAWLADKAAWRNGNGRICFRTQRLFEWAQTYRNFADGTRKNLMSMMQFTEAIRKLEEGDEVSGKMTQYGVQYRSLSFDESAAFMRTKMGLYVDEEAMLANQVDDEGELDL